MTISELTQYLTDYLHTNDSKTLGYIQTFITLAARRVKARLTSVLIEKTGPFTPSASVTLPTDFVAARSITMDGVPLQWLALDQFRALAAAIKQDITPPDGSIIRHYYSYTANQLLIAPTPIGTEVGEIIYYGFNPESPTELAELLPTLLIRGAALEAYLYEGDTEQAQAEDNLFQSDLSLALGTIYQQSGTLSLGGVR